MRIFMNSGLYKDYLKHFNSVHGTRQSFRVRLSAFLKDGFGAPHILFPVLNDDSSAFFTNGDDESLQRAWAAENGLPPRTSLRSILLTQIEAHRAEIFYNLDPIRYGSDFVKDLPGCVRKSICWRAAPSHGADFMAYDLVLGNFPNILEHWNRQGCCTKYFSPAWDMDQEQDGTSANRPIDVAFVGSYSRHHRRRNRVLEAIAEKKADWNVVYCLASSRSSRLASTVMRAFTMFTKNGQSTNLRRLIRPPIYGQALYSLLRSAKIVFNAHGEIAGDERGNMRCFEAMGCGSLLVSDKGKYPDGFVAQENYVDYANADQAIQTINDMLLQDYKRLRIAKAGINLMCQKYNKVQQWADFQELAA